MNILQVTLGFYPASGWGGPTKIVYENSRELIKRGHNVSVYCTNLIDKRNYIKKGTFESQIDGIRVVYFHTLRIPNWPGTLGPIYLPDLPRILNEEGGLFDIIQINGYRNILDLQITDWARKHNKPFIIQPHGVFPIIINSHLIKSAYDIFFGNTELKGVSAVIALQASEKQQALQYGISEDLIHIIPNGLNINSQINVAKRGEFRKKYDIPQKSCLLLFLGRINKKKGTDLLIEALSQITDLDCYLAIVGPDDGQLDEVNSLIKKYSLEKRVRLTGLLSGNDIAAAYFDSDIFVLPCRTDTFPTTIMEACYYKIPMIITDGCESADLVKDRVADVVPPNPKYIAESIRKLSTNKSLYKKYKNNCPKLMQEKFSIDFTVDCLEELYNLVIKNQEN